MNIAGAGRATGKLMSTDSTEGLHDGGGAECFTATAAARYPARTQQSLIIRSLPVSGRSVAVAGSFFGRRSLRPILWSARSARNTTV